MSCIPAANIGNFKSMEQKRLYDKMNAVLEPTKELADEFVRADNRSADANYRVEGSVMLDSENVNGICQFEPSTGRILSFEANAKKLNPNFEYDVPSRHFLWEHYSMRPSDDGSVTYTSPKGTVTVNPDGTLTMD